MTRVGRPRCRRRRSTGALEDLRPCVLQFLRQRQRELLGLRRITHPRRFRGQLTDAIDQALIFEIEEETNLSLRFKIVLLTQQQHRRRI